MGASASNAFFFPLSPSMCRLFGGSATPMEPFEKTTNELAGARFSRNRSEPPVRRRRKREEVLHERREQPNRVRPLDRKEERRLPVDRRTGASGRGPTPVRTAMEAGQYLTKRSRNLIVPIPSNLRFRDFVACL